MLDEVDDDRERDKLSRKLGRAAEQLTALDKVDNPEAIDLGTMTKVRDFIDGLADEGSTLGKVLQGVGNGLKRAQQLGRHYNSIAEWTGLPNVPRALLGNG